MKRPGGPRLARWIAEILLPERDREFVLGDLEELHALRSVRHGRSSADLRYWRDAVVSVTSRLFRRGAPGPSGGRGTAFRRGSALREIIHDLAQAARGLAREKRFSALVVLTLALGIGSSTAVFGMVNQLVLRPLPGVANGDAAYLRFLSISEPQRLNGKGLPLADFDALRRNVTLLDGIASYGWLSLHLARGSERPIDVTAQTVYGDFFGVLGVVPANGRLLGAEDTRLESDPHQAVISEELATRLFGEEDPVGQTIRARGAPLAIIGVAGGDFRGPERGREADLWVPHGALVPLLDFPAERLESRGSAMHGDIVVALPEGVAIAAAQAEVEAVLEALPRGSSEHAEFLDDLRPALFPGVSVPPMWRERTSETLRLLAVAVGLVLLLACANGANLLLFRNILRRGAVATRRALGASAGRIARYHLVESLMLAAVATMAGLGVGWLVTLPFQGEQLYGMPALERLTLDGRVLAFGVLLAVGTAMLFGAVPATLAGRFDLGTALKEGGGQDTRRLAGLRWTISAVQIALCLTLLTGGLLLARTLHNLYTLDTGLAIDGIYELPIELPRDLDPTAHQALLRNLLSGVAEVPGVQRAALELYGPHGSRSMARVAHVGDTDDEAELVQMWPVSPDWFGILDVKTTSGRPLRSEDEEEGRSVVVTGALARRLFGSTEAVGRTLRAGFRELEEVQVVGVTEDLKSAISPDEPIEAFFVPHGLSPIREHAVLLVRMSAGSASALRGEVESWLPDLPVADPTPLARRFDRIHGERRIMGRLLGLLAGLAALLSAVGLYGVISFAVAGRTREFGIRLALGADATRITRLVLSLGAKVVLAGVAGGVFGAWLLSRGLESRLFGVAPSDPIAFGGATLLLMIAALAACWAPARAALRVDPVETLRSE